MLKIDLALKGNQVNSWKKDCSDWILVRKILFLTTGDCGCIGENTTSCFPRYIARGYRRTQDAGLGELVSPNVCIAQRNLLLSLPQLMNFKIFKEPKPNFARRL